MARLVVLAWVRWLAGIWVNPCWRERLGLWLGVLLGRARGLTRNAIGFCGVILELAGEGVSPLQVTVGGGGPLSKFR